MRAKLYWTTEEWKARVRQRMKEMNLSPSVLAAKIGCTQPMINYLFNEAKSSSLVPAIEQVLGWKSDLTVWTESAQQIVTWILSDDPAATTAKVFIDTKKSLGEVPNRERVALFEHAQLMVEAARAEVAKLETRRDALHRSIAEAQARLIATMSELSEATTSRDNRVAKSNILSRLLLESYRPGSDKGGGIPGEYEPDADAQTAEPEIEFPPSSRRGSKAKRRPA